MQLVVSAVDAVGEVATIRDVGEVEVPGPAWGGEGVGLAGDEGERVGGGEAGGPVLTASESVIETVAVGVIVKITVPVIYFAFLIAVVAGLVLPATVIVVIEREVFEDLERVVRPVSIWFERLGRGDRVDMRRLVN